MGLRAALSCPLERGTQPIVQSQLRRVTFAALAGLPLEGIVILGIGHTADANPKERLDMEVKKKSVSVIAALLTLGIAGPAVAIADGGNNNNDNGTPVTTKAPAPASGQGQSTADEQESGEQGDVENTDLATQVEEVDGANNQDGVNEEDEVGDGNHGD
jgi:hypothetical protein